MLSNPAESVDPAVQQSEGLRVGVVLGEAGVLTTAPRLTRFTAATSMAPCVIASVASFLPPSARHLALDSRRLS
ncbi:MAG TPA: hypothetical protein ENJ18_14610 [Nannocystis exedens]|nr:hypothetical protein [Nannocystis exedens]